MTFTYAGSNQPVVKATFTCILEKRLHLIGENGAGKTTLVKLLARLYDPTAGQMLDGIDLREYDVEDLRHEIGVIFQDYMRYDMLVRENIGFGKIESWLIIHAHGNRGAKEPREKPDIGFKQFTIRWWDGDLKAAWIFRAANGRS